MLIGCIATPQWLNQCSGRLSSSYHVLLSLLLLNFQCKTTAQYSLHCFHNKSRTKEERKKKWERESHYFRVFVVESTEIICQLDSRKTIIVEGHENMIRLHSMLIRDTLVNTHYPLELLVYLCTLIKARVDDYIEIRAHLFSSSVWENLFSAYLVIGWKLLSDLPMIRLF